MFMPAFTARNVTKFVVKAVVHGKTAQLTEQAIVDHTQFEEDAIAVDIAGNLVGWYLSEKLKPYTDAAVDKTFDFVAEKREQRQNRKNTDEEK